MISAVLAVFVAPLFGVSYGSLLVTAAEKPAATASLYLTPPSGSFAVGSTFTVSIFLNTAGQTINAIQADLTFPADRLQVVSPSSGKSFIETWVAQPSYSNSHGTLRFQGAIPAPGVATSAGLVSSITFRVVNTGTATIRFMDTSRVLLNNGFGTDVLGQMTNGIYTLTVPPPQGPIVTSPTNPDQTKWYKTNAVTLQWAPALPFPVQGYSYVINDSPTDTPDDTSEGLNTFVTYRNLTDGLHYFHLKALRGGVWGGVTDFAIRVDNNPPAATEINVSPGKYTASQDIILQFGSTDSASGVDHYELKVIALAPSHAAENQNTPFFSEVTSPYIMHLPLGRYDVFVRVFDVAGNYYQATTNLSIVSPLFEILGNDGLRIGGFFVIGWWYIIGFALLIIALLIFGLWKAWIYHRDAEARLARGAEAHPEIVQKLAELKLKQKEYEDALKHLAAAVLIVIATGWGLSTTVSASRAMAATSTDLSLNPPLINLHPTELSNDEVLYLGGWANVPDAQVQIYIEHVENGDTFSGIATTGPDGNWFYSFPQLLSSGNYAVWAQLKSGDVLSAPSARVNIGVFPTAIQIGGARLNYAEFYLLLLIIFAAIALALVILIIIYLRRAKIKRKHLEAAIREAEESIRRGFSVLQRDMQMELASMEKLKLQGAIPDEVRAREEKLQRDLEDVRRYIGKEIWHIEEEEAR